MRVISRLRPDGVDVFDAAMDLVRTFPTPPPGSYKDPGTQGYAAPAARDRLAYATEDAVVLIDPDGRPQWRFDLGVRGPGRGVAAVDVAFSADDALVWVYAPDAMADRGEDVWFALDAATGEVRARHVLPTVGHGGNQCALPDGRMLLGVGEGQDGVRIYLAGPGTPQAGPGTSQAGPGTSLHDFGWDDRVLIAASPDGSQFMTVGHEQEDLLIHDLPDGRTRLRLTAADFGFAARDEVFLEWSGGYLDEHTVIAVLAGVDDEAESADEEEWWRHYRVDARTGEVLGELRVTTIDQYDLTPLGDGTYVITDTDGTPRRM
ncbi:hypothetical protein [Actinoplanes sp. DH11]|uniref:hypothetical protein n=1 Tax=Actinoplanes sp. DH11 TaxID=2857011 RepID=UPI001E58AF3F|nr:hypothetical protein [Actinoplanes sp. DH11]